LPETLLRKKRLQRLFRLRNERVWRDPVFSKLKYASVFRLTVF